MNRLLPLFLFVIFFSLLTLNSVYAQSPLSLPEQRLCKTWTLERTKPGEKANGADMALNDFVMIINTDHSVKQGMSPDGLIAGTWSINEKTMVLTIRDSVTAQEYKMKMVSITADELILMDPAGDPSVYIHYRAN